MTDFYPGTLPGEYIPTDQRPPLPIGVRAEVYRRADGHCECCHKKCHGELHHTTYYFLHPNADKTPACELKFLCRSCHKAAHIWMGVFWADIDELDGERDYFRNMIEKE